MSKATPTHTRDATAFAFKELAKEQSDVLAFADQNREIVDLPAGLETGVTARRKRGTRTDLDCINEICEIVAQGITATAAVKYVGVPWATWQKWLKLNHQEARERFDFAYTAHLEVMADRTIQIYEELKAKREAAQQKHGNEMRMWRIQCSKLRKNQRQPPPPAYEGPSEWELSLAEKQVSVRKWHLASRHEKFKKALDAAAARSTEINLNVRIETKEEARQVLIESGMLIEDLTSQLNNDASGS